MEYSKEDLMEKVNIKRIVDVTSMLRDISDVASLAPPDCGQ